MKRKKKFRIGQDVDCFASRQFRCKPWKIAAVEPNAVAAFAVLNLQVAAVPH